MLTFGPARYYRPVCVRYQFGFLGGPMGYEETTGPDIGPRIVEAWRQGDLTLDQARDALDWVENRK